MQRYKAYAYLDNFIQNLGFSLTKISITGIHKIGEYAITSSMRDRRFNPVEPNEIPNLRCSVSLLTDYEHNKKWNDWVVGTHGIIIDFLVQGKKYNATYLPQVAAEQEWNVKDTVLSFIRKSGYRGKVDQNILSNIVKIEMENALELKVPLLVDLGMGYNWLEAH